MMINNNNSDHRFENIKLAGVAGFEPTLTVLETVALPLNYTPV